jgi:small subunit ribosomal protein S1
VIKGKVVQISNDEVLVDIDYKSEGRIPLNELSFISNANPEDLVSVGEEIHVKVLKVDDAEGNVLLSKKRADADRSWEKLENLFETGGTLRLRLCKWSKGGFWSTWVCADLSLPVMFPGDLKMICRNI